MRDLSYLKRSVYSAVTFFGTLLVLSIGYGALVGGLSSTDKVGSGSGLTSTSWNRIVDGVLDIDTRVTSVTGKFWALTNGKWCTTDGTKIDCIGDVPTWNTGATGPVWPTGATGLQWPAGPQWLTGPTGSSGPTWPQWPVGATGPAGLTSIVSESTCTASFPGATALGIIITATEPNYGAITSLAIHTCTCTYSKIGFSWGWRWLYGGSLCS